MKKILIIISMFTIIFTIGCNDARVASRNLSTASEQFEVYRRVVFYNGITDTYILSVQGYCSIEVDNIDNQLELVVKTAPGQYIKHFLGISDNVTYFVEQLESKNVSTDKYRVIFKPSVIVPNIDIE